MKQFLTVFFFGCLIIGCASNNGNELALEEMNRIDTLRIAHDSLKNDLVFIEQGLKYWLDNEARPKEKYSLEFLEERNFKMVETYNFRCHDKMLFSDLYQKPIVYNPRINYGKDFHYQLYNYLLFFQEQYSQNL